MRRAPCRVLVTRPEPGASETAQRLEALGFLPLKLPLHEIRPLPVNAGTMPGKTAAVAVTSANAVRHAPGALLERLSGLPCFAVGETSALPEQSVRKHDFRLHFRPGCRSPWRLASQQNADRTGTERNGAACPARAGF